MKQLTFPQIRNQRHPQATGSRVNFDQAVPETQPDELDLAIADEILTLQQKIAAGLSATGEWKRINEKKRSGYLQALAEEDVEKLATLLCNFFRNETSFGIVTGTYAALEALENRVELENNLLLDLDAWLEFTERTDIENMDMPKTGNPFGVHIESSLLAPDTPRHDYFALKIIELTARLGRRSPRILEIGGGYGGMALQIARRSSCASYINCDLPETLFVAYYFLRKSTDRQISWALNGLEEKDVNDGSMIMVPAHAAANIACQIDLVFNSNSFSEMARETVEQYFRIINLLKPNFILHQNSNYLMFPNSDRHIEVLAREFPIDHSAYREEYRAVAPWQGASGRYREFLYCLRASFP